MIAICLALLAAGPPIPAVGVRVNASLPIRAYKVDRIGEGHWVRIDLTVSSDADGTRIDGHITCVNRTTFKGFRGRGLVVLRDARGNIIKNGWCVLPTSGVNGTFIGRNTATKFYHADIPPKVACRVAKVEVMGLYDDDEGFINQLKKIVGDAFGAYKEVAGSAKK